MEKLLTRVKNLRESQGKKGRELKRKGRGNLMPGKLKQKAMEKKTLYQGTARLQKERPREGRDFWSRRKSKKKEIQLVTKEGLSGLIWGVFGRERS